VKPNSISSEAAESGVSINSLVKIYMWLGGSEALRLQLSEPVCLIRYFYTESSKVLHVDVK